MTTPAGVLRWAPRQWVTAYLEHHGSVDFALLAMIFIAVAYGTLRYRFPGRPGRLLAVVTGFTLAGSLTMAMVRREISLMSLAWLPLIVLAALAGLTGLAFLKRAGIGMPTAGGAVILIVAIALLGTSPKGHAPWAIVAGKLAPWLGAVLVVHMATRLLGPYRPSRRIIDHRNLGGRTQSAVGTSLRCGDWLGRQFEGLRRSLSQSDGRAKDVELVRHVRRLDGVCLELKELLQRTERAMRGLERQQARAMAGSRHERFHGQKGIGLAQNDLLELRRKELATTHDNRQLLHKAIHQVNRIRHCLGKADGCLKADLPQRAERWMALAQRRREALAVLLATMARRQSDLGRILEEDRRIDPPRE